MHNTKALVFDMDGTLLNTLEDLADSTNFPLQQHNFPIHHTSAYRHFVGSGARELVSRAMPLELRKEDQILAVLNTFKDHYDNNWCNQTSLYKGMAELLNWAVQNKLKLAIITNKPQQFASKCVELFLSDWHFDFVQGQQDGIPHKPDAAMSTPVTDALKLLPSEIMYLGDSDIDMFTAQNGGYKAVGVTWGFRSEEELTTAGAEHIIHSPLETVELIKL